jgi:hypothetical protein
LRSCSSFRICELKYDLFEFGYEALQRHHRYGLNKTLKYKHLSVITDCLLPEASSLIELRSRRSKGEDRTDFSLWELFNIDDLRTSSNALNAVYRLLGLIRFPEVPIVINYSMSPIKLFADLAVNFIGHSSMVLNISSLVGISFL